MKNNYLLLLRLLMYVDKSTKKRFLKLIVLIFIGSISEVVSIGMIIPFLIIIQDYEKISNLPVINNFFLIISNHTGIDLIFIISFGFIALTIITALLRLLLLWYGNKTYFIAGNEIGTKVFSAILSKNYKYFVDTNINNIINDINNKTNIVVHNSIMPGITLINAVAVLSVSLSFLLYYKPTLVIITFFSVVIIYYFIARILSKSIKNIGIFINQQSIKSQQLLYEAINGIRDLILFNSKNFFINKYKNIDLNLRVAQAKSLFMAQSPRQLLEAVATVSLVTTALYFSLNSSDVDMLIPTLGVIALAAQRLMPLMQNAFVSWAAMKSSEYALTDLINLLKDSQSIKVPREFISEKNQYLKFDHNINLNNLYFAYNKQKPIIKNFNLVINKGDFIGVVGKTGSGKSTLLDIIMGFSMPDEGVLLVDNVKVDLSNISLWQKKISHVPQSIYLIDDTVKSNIAIATTQELIDDEKVIACAKIAKVHDEINSMPMGYESIIGDKGSRLSGGQRQRIGIARALYRDFDLLILDEATSALDQKTEIEVLESLSLLKSSKTIIFITHKNTVLDYCNRVISL